MSDTDLIAEQLRHTIDLLRGELSHLRAIQDHDRQTVAHRLDEVGADCRDHEARIRDLTNGVTHFRVLAGLATGGGLLGTILALVSLIEKVIR